MEFSHVPVLLNETIEGLNIKENGIYVDGTAGGRRSQQRDFKNALQRADSSQLTGIPTLYWL